MIVRRVAALLAAAALAGCGKPPPPPEPAPPPVQSEAMTQAELAPPPPPPPALDVSQGGWSGPKPTGAYRGDQIYDYMDGEGEIPVACGYRALHVAEYQHTSGLKAKLELHDMVTAANAFGLYSQRRGPDDTFVELTHRARASDQQVIFWKSSWCLVLLAEPPEQGKQELLLSLARQLDGKFADPGALPELLRYLPAEGLTPNSAGYFHGKFALDTHWPRTDNLLNVGPRTDVVCADYDDGSTVVIVEYPNSSAAAGVMTALTEPLQLAPAAAGGFIGRDDNGPVAAIADGERVGLVLYNKDDQAAAARLAQLAASLKSPGPVWTEG